MEDYRLSHAEDGYGCSYEKTYNSGYYRTQWENLEKPILGEIFQDAKKNGSTRILDFACGTGRILQEAEKYFEGPWGVDVSSAMLNRCQLRCKKSHILEIDITKTPIDERFDVITAFRFFLNAQVELRNEVLRTLSSMLEPNGILVANIHVNEKSPLGRIYKMRNYFCGKTIANTMKKSNFSEELNNHGLIITKIHYYSFLPRTGPWMGGVTSKIMLPFERVCRKLTFLEEYAQSFIVVCEKQT